MSPTSFCYWLQGALELHNIKTLSAKQLQVVRNHLNLVFMHIDMQDPPEKQEALQAAHDGKQDAMAQEALDKAVQDIRDQLKPLDPNGPTDESLLLAPHLQPIAQPKPPRYIERQPGRDRRLRC